MSLRCILFFLLTGASCCLQAQVNGPIRISDNGRFFTHPDGTPFFWMADTAWELFHRTDIREAEFYLEKRSRQGFNVIKAVALAEIDGLRTPSTNGDLPFVSLESLEFNEPYWKYVDEVMDLAESFGLHIALLPTWGDKLYKDSWGEGPEIFNKDSAFSFGEKLGKRYANRKKPGGLIQELE
ncbi:DUF4038 domain-containing protein [Arthrospiribacter ruber]|uniref:DUF4038 domain-containing protein n=1 Tax=Arthrospiribacter ruber TaxID=2487934 RepID=A0A951MC05_9BACT|nr:DUF4038 domain-containing protein [Arthrospiribacter ruber]MBW3467172.1 DUF4038 domain-containing protein [Arthrospiribacter ruber]